MIKKSEFLHTKYSLTKNIHSMSLQNNSHIHTHTVLGYLVLDKK